MNASDPLKQVIEKTRGQEGALPGKSCMKDVRGTGSTKQVKFRLTSRYEYSCRCHDRCSSYPWNHWQSTMQRSGGPQPRYSPKVLKAPSEFARRTSTDLVKELYSRLRGNATGAACPATGSPKLGRNFVLDSGASFNIIGRDDLTHAEVKTIRSCKAIRLNTAVEY